MSPTRLLTGDEPLLSTDELQHVGSSHWFPVPPQMIGMTLRQAASAEWFTGAARREVETDQPAGGRQ